MLLVTLLVVGRRVSVSRMEVSGLEVPSRWGGEAALEVLGLGCSGELVANPSSFPAVDSILMIFLEQSLWLHFLFMAGSV